MTTAKTIFLINVMRLAQWRRYRIYFVINYFTNLSMDTAYKFLKLLILD